MSITSNRKNSRNKNQQSRNKKQETAIKDEHFNVFD